MCFGGLKRGYQVWAGLCIGVVFSEGDWGGEGDGEIGSDVI